MTAAADLFLVAVLAGALWVCRRQMRHLPPAVPAPFGRPGAAPEESRSSGAAVSQQIPVDSAADGCGAQGPAVDADRARRRCLPPRRHGRRRGSGGGQPRTPDLRAPAAPNHRIANVSPGVASRGRR